ncbi:MAG: hypothetical protein WDA22_17430 [Bacteroidota bacterium]
MGSLYVFEMKTGYALYNRLDHRVQLLERLHVLQKDSINKSEDLSHIYQSIITELESSDQSSFSFQFRYEPFIKFFSAALIPFVFMLIASIQLMQGQPGASSLFVGAVFITLLIGVPAVYIPTFNSVWINSGIYVVFQFIMMYVISIYGNIVKNKQ